MGPALQAMQEDDTQNPAMLWVREGEAQWTLRSGHVAKSCADCHGEIGNMRGVAARYPAMSDPLGRPLALGGRINQCRQSQQQAPPFAAESRELLALESALVHQSRGMAMSPAPDPRLAAFVERGQSRYFQRLGQLNLSCAHCHDRHAGARLGGSLIPQAHPIGYPAYRLEWQTMGSLQRRLRNCMNGVRAQAFAFGSQELVELELYLAWRAKGMLLEKPSVRP